MSMPPPGHPAHPEMSPIYGPGALSPGSAGSQSSTNVPHTSLPHPTTLDEALELRRRRQTSTRDNVDRAARQANDDFDVAVRAMRDFLSRNPRPSKDTWTVREKARRFGGPKVAPDPFGLNQLYDTKKEFGENRSTYRGAWLLDRQRTMTPDNDDVNGVTQWVEWWLSPLRELVLWCTTSSSGYSGGSYRAEVARIPLTALTRAKLANAYGTLGCPRTTKWPDHNFVTDLAAQL